MDGGLDWLWPLLPVALWFALAVAALRNGPEALARGRLRDLTALAIVCALLGWMLLDADPAAWSLPAAVVFLTDSFHPAALLGKVGIGGALYALFVAGLYGSRVRRAVDPVRPPERPPELPSSRS